VFSDLLLPLEPMGIAFDFLEGEGPAIDSPLRSEADLSRVHAFEPRESLACVLDAIRQACGALGRLPLIGFGGAPFTLASYAIEGGHSASFAHTKELMYSAPAAWHRFCAMLADVVSEYLIAQVEAGAAAIQLFDSWVGALNGRDYREFVLPHTRHIFDRLAPCQVPLIHFGVGTGAILEDLSAAGGDVIGVDWRTPLDEAWVRVGEDRAVQGNLDPTVLLGPLDRIMAAADDVLARAGGRPGHIFNLGHGILPMTPVEHVQALAQYVHQRTQP